MDLCTIGGAVRREQIYYKINSTPSRRSLFFY